MAVKVIIEGIDMRALRSALSATRKAACKAMAKYWLDNYLKLHFRMDAVQRYGYAERVKNDGGPGEQASRKRGRDKRPLVSSGRLVSMVTRGAKVRVYRDKGLVVMPAPDYVRFRGMTGELTAITPEEAAECAKAGGIALRNALVRRMKRIKWTG